MQTECLSHSALPCEPLGEMYGELCYKVKTTGATVTLSSSVSLLYFYCSRLPSDGYFKPYPYCNIYKELESCTLLLPNSCPVQIVEVQGNVKLLKQLACLEACKLLHQCGELTDNLVPNILEEEANTQESGCESYVDEHAKMEKLFLTKNIMKRGETLLYGKGIFTVQNYLQKCRTHITKEPSDCSYELPPELCSIIMSPISISTFYSFSFVPSVMHRIESLLMAANLKSLHMDSCIKNYATPTLLVLEAFIRFWKQSQQRNAK